MESAVFDQTGVEIDADGVGLRATGSILKFDGFLKIYQVQEEKDNILPGSITPAGILTLENIDSKQHFTQPPARYTEASLIKELEERGIGRPSTYAPTISTIQDRGYVRLESRAFIPTELGRDVNSLLVKNYPNILDVDFTVRMEDTLDKIEEGSRDYAAAMQDFYKTYSNEHETAQTEMENLKTAQRPSGVKCEKCGRDMLIKLGKNGHFLGCAGYPECTNTAEYSRDEHGKILAMAHPEPEVTDQKCEKCGAPMLIKHGRFGEFLACSNYPQCKNTSPLEKPEITDKKCDKCGAPMVVKKSRRGPFLGCSSYPDCKNIMPYPTGLKCPVNDCKGEIVQQVSKRGKTYYACDREPCDFLSWNRPVEKKCPECGCELMIKKNSRLTCANPECTHEEDEKN